MGTDNILVTSKDTLALKREEFHSIGISISLPETFRELTEEERNRRPTIPDGSEVVRVDMENKLSFMVNTTPVEIKNTKSEPETVVQLISDQKKVFSRLSPGYQEAGLWRKEIDGHTVACLSYKSNSIEDDLYTVFFLCIHKGNMIFGTFTSVYSDDVEWNPTFLMCLESLQFIEK